MTLLDYCVYCIAIIVLGVGMTKNEYSHAATGSREINYVLGNTPLLFSCII